LYKFLTSILVRSGKEKDPNARVVSYPAKVPENGIESYWDAVDRHYRARHGVVYERLLMMSDDEISTAMGYVGGVVNVK
jgi:hypothetical protein